MSTRVMSRMVIAPLAVVAFVALVALVATVAAAKTGQQPVQVPVQQPVQRSRIAFDRDLPPMDGKKLNMKVIDLHIAPNESSAPHKHGCAVVVYVVSGAMRMQVRGGRDSVYRSGETFHERPDDIHQVSANASATDSAHFTATFVCDHVGPLSTPANASP